MGFRKQTALSNINSPTLINPQAIGFNQFNLNQLYIKYLSDTYPQQSYSMNLINSFPEQNNDILNSYIVSSSSGANFDTTRAYEDYLLNSEFDTPEEAMTLDEWCSNPIFVFKFCNTTNQSSNIEINISCSNSIAGIYDTQTNTIVGTLQTDNDLNGVILYLTYVYRTIVESDFGEDSVSYKVYNVA